MARDVGDIIGNEMIHLVRELSRETIKEIGENLIDNLPSTLSPNPTDEQVEQAIKDEPTVSDACRKLHRDGWRKGLIVGAAIVLIGVGGLALSRK